MEQKFSGCEIVEMAIQIEENGKAFYDELIKKVDIPEVIEVLKRLSADETRHIEVFRGLFNSVCDYDDGGEYTEEYFAYLNALTRGHVFTQKEKAEQLIKDISSFKEGLKLAMSFEKDTILFFEELKKAVTAKDRGIVESLIVEEKKHLSDLSYLTGSSEDEKC